MPKRPRPFADTSRPSVWARNDVQSEVRRRLAPQSAPSAFARDNQRHQDLWHPPDYQPRQPLPPDYDVGRSNGVMPDDDNEPTGLEAVEPYRTYNEQRWHRLLPGTTQRRDDTLYSSAFFNDPRIIIPHANDPFEYPFVVTETTGTNSLDGDTIETDIFQYLVDTYKPALELAARRVGVDLNNGDIYAKAGKTGARVRVLIFGVPVRDANDDETDNVVIDSPNTAISPALQTTGVEQTVFYLYDAIVRKFLKKYQNNSGQNIELLEQPSQLTIRYEFMFSGTDRRYDGQSADFNFNGVAQEARDNVYHDVEEAFVGPAFQQAVQAAANPATRYTTEQARMRSLARLRRNLETNLRTVERDNRYTQINASNYLTRARTQPIANRTRGASRRIGGTTPTEAFKSVRSSIYTRAKLTDFYRNDRDLVGIPDIPEKICFPMAFIASECRVYNNTLNEEGLPIPAIESITVEQHFIPEITTKSFCREYGLVDTFFFQKTGRNIILFHPLKKEVQGESRDKNMPKVFENEGEVSGDVLKTWIFCALYIHRLVESVWGEPVNVNDLDECMRSYSSVFGVSISIYNFASTRRIFHEPVKYEETPFDHRSIAMVVHGEHLSAIADLGLFLREGTVKKIPYYRICDSCGIARSEKETKAEQLQFEHQSVCFYNAAKEANGGGIEELPMEENKDDEIAVWGYPSDGKLYENVCFRCRRVDGCGCIQPEPSPTKFKCNTCLTCGLKVAEEYWHDHICYMKSKAILDKIPNEKLFVYDTESVMQPKIEGADGPIIEQHLPCLFIMMAMYDDREWCFRTVEEFMELILTDEQFAGSTILAHNGSAYDNLFVTKYCEDNCIRHKTQPTPGSLHRHLSVKLLGKEEKDNVNFIDFCRIFPSSLRDIAKCFGLPVEKGDFPHRFSCPDHLNYEGPLPSVDDPRDWYSLKSCKSDEEMADQKAYWLNLSKEYCYCHGKECDCGCKKWNYFEELTRYCRQDVVVLKAATAAYRDEMLAIKGSSEFDWAIDGIDPFCYTTMSQIALALFTQGKKKRDIWVSKEKLPRVFFPNSIHWFETVQEEKKIKIIHAGNSTKRWYDDKTNSYLDGFCRETNVVFLYYDCKYEGCRRCCASQYLSGELHPQRGINYFEIENRRKKKWQTLFTNYHGVNVHWSHDDPPEFENRRDGHLMRMRDFFYGGRTEVFAAFCDTTKMPGWEINYIDVVSEYPFVCSHRKMPVGVPKCMIGKAIDKTRLSATHPQSYFGFVRCRVLPNKNDLIAILPARRTIDGDTKLMFDLEEKEGCWHTELIYLALEHGYKILDIYEVWHWSPSQCSVNLFKGYMEYFLRMKQQSEGWEKMGGEILQEIYKKDGKDVASINWKNLSQEDKELICDEIKVLNGGFARPDPDKVEKNGVRRGLGKGYLNTLWGKLVQKFSSVQEKFVHTLREYTQLMEDPKVDPDSLKFRHINTYTFKAQWERRDSYSDETNAYLSMPIGASVTAHAQVLLMRKMFEVGPKNMLYCDTDSLIFKKALNTTIQLGRGLGNFAPEYDKDKILKFIALAPKCYMLLLESEVKGKVVMHESTKCKGVKMSVHNRKLITFDNFTKLVKASYEDQLEYTIPAKTMVIYPNSTSRLLPYGTLCTRHGSKDVGVVYTKRSMCRTPVVEFEQLGCLRLLPFGSSDDDGSGVFENDVV